MKEDLKRCPFCEEEFNSFSEEYDHECEICVDNLWIEGKIEDIQFAKKDYNYSSIARSIFNK
jgi:hypothetical protein